MILRTDSGGAIVDPDDTDNKYTIAATASLANSTNVVDHGVSSSAPWQFTGDLTWPSPGTNLPEFASGNYRIGVKYDDGHIDLTGSYIDVALSVYNVYTDNPFYPGANNSEGKTTLHYNLSSDANNVSIDIGGVKTLTYTGANQEGTHSGANTLANAWDGSLGQDQYVGGGSYGLRFNVTPTSGQQGYGLQLYSTQSYFGFTPAPPLNETLSIDFNVSEPVQRPQADPDQGKLTAVIYDSDGEFVRLLANESQCHINNQTGNTPGHNTIVWDGKDEDGEIVDPGSLD